MMKLPGSKEYQEVSLFGSSIWGNSAEEGEKIEILNTQPAIIHEEGLLISGSDGVFVNVKRVKINGKLIQTLSRISSDFFFQFKDE